MNTKLKIATLTAVLAAGLLAAPQLYAHESAPATQGASPQHGPMMGGNMMDHQAEGGMMGRMSEMMKACDGMMRDHGEFKAREPDDGHDD